MAAGSCESRLDRDFETCSWTISGNVAPSRLDEITASLGVEALDLESLLSWVGRSCGCMAAFVAHLAGRPGGLHSLAGTARANALRLFLSDASYSRHAIDGLLVPFLSHSTAWMLGDPMEIMLAQTALQRWLLATRGERGVDFLARRVRALEALELARGLQRRLAEIAPPSSSIEQQQEMQEMQQYNQKQYRQHEQEQQPQPQEALSAALKRVLATTHWPELHEHQQPPSDGDAASSAPASRAELSERADAQQPYSQAQGRKRSRRDEPAAAVAAAAAAAAASSAEMIDLINACQQFALQCSKAASGSAALSARQAQQTAAQAARLVDRLSDVSDPLDRAAGLLALAPWKLPDDVLSSLAEAVVASEHFRQASVVTLCCALLVRCRELASPASRLLLKAMEAVAKRCPELLVQCCFARVMCSPPAHAGISAGYAAMLPAAIHKGPAQAGGASAVQCELVLRACRQMLQPEALELLVCVMCTPGGPGGGVSLSERVFSSGAGAGSAGTRPLPQGLSPAAAHMSSLFDGLLSPLAGLPLALARVRGKDAAAAAAAAAAVVEGEEQEQVRDLSFGAQRSIVALWKRALGGIEGGNGNATDVSSSSNSSSSRRARGPEFLKTLHALVSSCPSLSGDTLGGLFAYLEDAEAAAAGDVEVGKWVASIIYACACKFPMGVKPLAALGRSMLKTHGGIMMAKSAMAALNKL